MCGLVFVGENIVPFTNTLMSKGISQFVVACFHGILNPHYRFRWDNFVSFNIGDHRKFQFSHCICNVTQNELVCDKIKENCDPWHGLILNKKI